MYVHCYQHWAIALTSDLVKEGVYLFGHGIDPYSGGLFRHVCYTYNVFHEELMTVPRTVVAITSSGLHNVAASKGRDIKATMDTLRCRRCVESGQDMAYAATRS
jgi:hypothetical protein